MSGASIIGATTRYMEASSTMIGIAIGHWNINIHFCLNTCTLVQWTQQTEMVDTTIRELMLMSSARV